MKIALAQINYHIGNFEANKTKMLEAIEKAKADKADLILFSELAVCGYPPRDFLEFNDFIASCDAVIQDLAAASKGIGIMVGAPSTNPNKEGKPLYNSGYFIADGRVEQLAHKALLPTYDVFDENRYFEPGTDFKVVNYKGKRIALTICEDIWNIGNENPMYTTCPMDTLVTQQPDFMVNLSASPFDYKHAEARVNICKENATRYDLPVFYVNHVGAQTELIFDGGSLVVTAAGVVYDEMPYFKEAYHVYDLEHIITSKETQSIDQVRLKEKIALIHDAIVLGIKDYFNKLGFTKAILGLSGGIDSAVTLVLAARALGAENVTGVMMPSKFSTDHSISDSELLVQNLGCGSDTIPIGDVFQSLEDTLSEQFKGLPFNIAEENMQARSRGIILMALSNKFGHIVLNTSNKSEASVGYGTLYGDMCGGLSVLGDVYKVEVFELAEYINKYEEVIPRNIITKPPSAELRPDQKDSDSLPEYADLDQILYQYIEHRKGPREIVAMGYPQALVDRILKLVNINEYKRYQTPPTLRVSPKAFGMGRRMPIVAKYLL